jgi:hypothetical protein
MQAGLLGTTVPARSEKEGHLTPDFRFPTDPQVRSEVVRARVSGLPTLGVAATLFLIGILGLTVYLAIHYLL